MTSYLYTTSLTVPAMTPIAAPVSLPVVLDDRQLARLRVIIPPGHAALTGLRVVWGGTQIVPYLAGTWLTGDDEIIDFDYAGEVTTNGLVLTGYNTDVYPHTFYQRWTLEDLAAALPVAISSPQSDAAAAAPSTGAIDQLAGVTDATVLLSPDDLAALAAAPDASQLVTS